MLFACCSISRLELDLKRRLFSSWQSTNISLNLKGKGLRVCEEGPVFDKKTLKKIEDFGVFKRNATGQKVKIK